MTFTILDNDCFRMKVNDCIHRYLGLSNEQKIAIGIYVNGHLYLNGNGINHTYMYDIGSISKTITAHLVLKLVEDGLIQLDAKIDKYLTIKKGEYPTINELLTHSAGYNNLTPYEITVPSLFKHGYSKKNIYENVTKEDIIHCIEKRNKCKHNKKYGYSDFSYAILGLIIEKVTNVKFSILFNEFINNELKMINTKVILKGIRFPYAMKGRKIFPYWQWSSDNYYLAAGGVVSNVQDMLKYLSLQIESKEKYIKKAHIISNEIIAKNNIRICKGWHSYVKSHQLWHVGGVGTFRSSIIVNKHKKIGVIVLGNSKGVNKGNVHYLTKMIYSELKINKVNLKV